ncbi:hypothetical protein N9249_01055, partial [bacterium]|nr:hypothetical protein [bacterium]
NRLVFSHLGEFWWISILRLLGKVVSLLGGARPLVELIGAGGVELEGPSIGKEMVFKKESST